MARYIDADKINADYIQSYTANADIYLTVRKILSDAPTADVVEVKHGEWLPVQYTYFGLKRYECSECNDDEYWQKRYLEHKEKYCPNCGAKMNLSELPTD